MDHHTVRFIILALAVGFSLLRAIRRRTAKRPRSDSAGRTTSAPAAETTRVSRVTRSKVTTTPSNRGAETLEVSFAARRRSFAEP